MSPVNIEIDYYTARSYGHELGTGSSGTVYAWGPNVVKCGYVTRDEAERLNQANAIVGDFFPRAIYKKGDTEFVSQDMIIMDRVPGHPIAYEPSIEVDKRYSVAYELTQILALYGIIQRDIHPYNFMVHNGVFYGIDGEALEISR